MPTLFSTVITNSRVDLNDVAGTRYTDSQLIGFANDGIREIKKVRPDLFFNTYATALSTFVSNDNVPIDDIYVQFLKDYIVFRAGLREDEDNSINRAAAFFARFKNGLITV